MATAENVQRSMLTMADQFKVAAAFESETGIEFRGWQAAVKWVKEKTGVEVTKSNLFSLRKAAGLKFIVFTSRKTGGGNQWSALRVKIEDFEKRLADLENSIKRISGDI